MDLTQRSEGIAGSDYTWLASSHGVDAAISGTIDFDSLVEATHFPNGFLQSGFAVGRITATGKYGPYNNDASDGRQTAVGFVVHNTSVSTGDVSVAIQVHGQVYNDRLPFPLDANGVTDLSDSFVILDSEVGS